MKIIMLLTIATILVATTRADEVATDEHRIRNLSIFSPDGARYAKSVKATKGKKGQKAPKISKAPKMPKAPNSPNMTTTMAPIMAPATDQNTMAPTMAPFAVQEEDDDYTPTYRELFCENNGFGEEECNFLGDCCQYDPTENECFADNASTTCGDDDMDPPTFDDDFMPFNRELYCENQGFGEVECNVRDGCCKYDASVNECFADNESSACGMITITNDDDDYYNFSGTNRDLICGGFGFGGPDEEECNNSPGDCCQYDSTENACFGNSASMTCDVKQLLCESPPDDAEMDIETNCAGLNMVLGDCCQYDSTENKCLAKSDSMACIFAPTDAPTDAPTMNQIS